MLLLILLFCIVIAMAIIVSKIKFNLNLTNKDILIRLGSIIICCGIALFSIITLGIIISELDSGTQGFILTTIASITLFLVIILFGRKNDNK